MITLENISKSFAGRRVLNDISLTIKPGEIVGLLGPNGAGKTTTLRIIAQVLPPTSGEIDIQSKTAFADPKELIGYLPENNPLYEEMTVEETLHFWANLKKIAPDQVDTRITETVADCGIGEVFYRPVAELSKGYRQRVGLSQALLTRPEILILDEPTEGLDPNQRHDIATLISRLGKSRTVIISSHVLSEIARIASRLVVIHKGQIVADDTPEKLKSGKGSGITIEAEITGARILTELKRLPGVTSVTEGKNNFFTIKSDRKNDPRASIFKLAVKNKWVITTLFKKEKDLEEVFGQLTSN
jgi:ABC-2 type transport system ATP-binding protein